MEIYANVAFHVLVIWTLAAVTPGANVLLTMNTALTSTRRLAAWSAMGVATAVLLWGFLGATGLLVVLNTFPWLFTAMKILGGSYLIYLGTSRVWALRKKRVQQETFVLCHQVSLQRRGIFFRAFITSVLNPKTGLFVISLFSVSMPATMTWTMTLMTMAIMGSVTLVWHLVLAAVFSTDKAQRGYHRASRVIDALTGGLFTLLGIRVISG
ncbi:LysE family transporter [Parasalinivibrio latis]|uniref:LysE family transporter n=1 Tax=Parasalinivibrio latis TaxID=2952610 RepID=UPI0030E5177D